MEREGRFRSISMPWWWGEGALLSRQTKWEGWLPKEVPLRIPKRPNALRLVEWGCSSFTAACVWQRMGQIAMITEPMAESSRKMLSICHVHEWADETVDISAGKAWGETDAIKFQNEISRIQPMYSALLAPSNCYQFTDIHLKWSSHFWIDGTSTGDLVGGCWNVFSLCREKFDYTLAVNKTVPVMTFDETYKRVDKCCEMTEQFPLGRYKLEESAGFVALQAIRNEKRPSRLSQYPPSTYREVKQETVRLPMVAGCPVGGITERWGSGSFRRTRYVEARSGQWERNPGRCNLADHPGKFAGIDLRYLSRGKGKRKPLFCGTRPNRCPGRYD